MVVGLSSLTAYGVQLCAPAPTEAGRTLSRPSIVLTGRGQYLNRGRLCVENQR
jgi:hypothetical protein